MSLFEISIKKEEGTNRSEVVLQQPAAVRVPLRDDRNECRARR
ncbi:MAG TPA: hypothetical protein VH575_29105 [Gemmataceae bacterium]|jgi:hypothetical protein